MFKDSLKLAFRGFEFEYYCLTLYVRIGHRELFLARGLSSWN